MEILFRGQLPSERLYTGECSNCSTRIKFKESEASYSGTPSDPYPYVACPVCKHTNIVGRSVRERRMVIDTESDRK